MDDLPDSVKLLLIDSEIARLTKLIVRFPHGSFADRCRADRDRQLDLRCVVMDGLPLGPIGGGT